MRGRWVLALGVLGATVALVAGAVQGAPPRPATKSTQSPQALPGNASKLGEGSEASSPARAASSQEDRDGGAPSTSTAGDQGDGSQSPVPPAPRSDAEMDALLPRLGSPDPKQRLQACESIRRAGTDRRDLYLSRLERHAFHRHTEAQRLLLTVAGVELPGPSTWFNIPKLKPGEMDPAETDMLKALIDHRPPRDADRNGSYARALETLCVLRGLAGMQAQDIADPLVRFAFEPYGVTFRYEIIRAIRSLGGWAVPALLELARMRVYDYKKERAKYLLQRFGAYLLTTMEQADPHHALTTADRPLQRILLAAYGRLRHADALEALLALSDHQDLELRKAARDALRQFFVGKAPRARVKRLKLPGGMETDHHQKLYLTYRERAVHEVRSALEHLTQGRYDRSIPGVELMRLLFAKQDELRRTHWSRKLQEAIALAQSGDREGAMRVGEEVLRQEPQLQGREALFPLYLERAEALTLKGRLLEAASLLERGALLLPGPGGDPALVQQRRATLADATYLRALALEASGQRQGAIALHRQALGLWSSHPGSLVALEHLDPKPTLDSAFLWALVLLAGLGAPGLLLLVQALKRLRAQRPHRATGSQGESSWVEEAQPTEGTEPKETEPEKSESQTGEVRTGEVSAGGANMKRGGYLVMDIESVPDEELYQAPEIPFGEEKPFPPIHAHRPVAIGALWLSADLSFIRIGIIGEEEDEAGQLAAFSDFVEREAPTLVTWNGRGFDLPVIVMRCLHHGIPMGWYYQRSNLRYRFSDDGHLDLADALSDRGAVRMTGLDIAARLVGLPGKMGVNGSQVEGYFRAGRLEEIRHYCLTDVIQTACLLLRYLLLADRAPRELVLKGLTGLLTALETDGRFGPFLEAVDRERLLLT